MTTSRATKRCAPSTLYRKRKALAAKPAPRRTRFKGRCQHCKEWALLRPRKLCPACYYCSRTRNLYPRFLPGVKPAGGSAAVRVQETDFYGPAALPEQVCAALPGSPEKMEELARRVKGNKALFHPSDARMDLR